MPMLPTMAIGLNSRTEATGGGMALTLTGTLTICGLSQGPMRYTRVTITSPGENIASNRRRTIRVQEPLATAWRYAKLMLVIHQLGHYQSLTTVFTTAAVVVALRN